jgi:hypothetical protein
MSHVSQILKREQKPIDYACQTDVAEIKCTKVGLCANLRLIAFKVFFRLFGVIQPFLDIMQACLKSIACLETHNRMFADAVEKSTLDVFNAEVGHRFYGCV